MLSKKSPQLRFKGFTDDWEDRNLKDILREFSTKSKIENEYRVLSSTNVGMEFRDGRVSGTSNLGYKIIKNGDLVLSPQNLWLGNININNIGTGLVSPSYKTFNFTDIDSSFIKPQLRTPKMLEEYKNSSTQGASVVRRNLEIDSFYQIKIATPSIKEQEKIGSFFKHLDSTISLHQRKLDLLKEQKKGYLQKMFPKNGEKVPELRFEGFADDWEERKLSSMTNYKNGKSHEDKQSTSGKLELINLNSISISGGLKHSGKFIDEADDTLQKDDLVMILSDVGHGDLLGRVALIPEDDRFVLNQRVALLRPNTTADPQFLFSYINAHQYYFKAQGAGMSQLNISKGSVENFISFVPIIEEQKKIGAFYKRLDDTIALHQRKLDLLKEQKKGFLQKMFV